MCVIVVLLCFGSTLSMGCILSLRLILYFTLTSSSQEIAYPFVCMAVAGVRLKSTPYIS